MRVVAFGRSGRGCADPPFRASMVIFVAPRLRAP